MAQTYRNSNQRNNQNQQTRKQSTPSIHAKIDRLVDSDGNTQYSDIAHAVTKEVREAINKQVLDAYNQALEESQNDGFTEIEDDDLPFDEDEDGSMGFAPSM